MLYYYGWQYVALPAGSAPPDALAFAEARIAAEKSAR